MTDRKYYYMRLKDTFFDDEKMVLLESMQDGILYSNILLKLYLKSLKNNGKLMLTETIPYNANMIATITRHNVGTVEKAISIFVELGMIDIFDSGEMYMLDIQNYVGTSSTEADRKRQYRASIQQKKDKCPDICLTEIEIDIEKDIELKKDIDIELKKEKEKEIEKTKEKVFKDTKKKKTAKAENIVVYFPNNELLDKTFNDFIDNRKALKKPMTDRAITISLNKLNKIASTDSEKIEILENSIMNGWAGVFPLKKDYRQSKEDEINKMLMEYAQQEGEIPNAFGMEFGQGDKQWTTEK